MVANLITMAWKCDIGMVQVLRNSIQWQRKKEGYHYLP